MKETRKMGVKTLAKRIDEISSSFGYERKKSSLWIRSRFMLKTAIELQKSSGGQKCYINILVHAPLQAKRNAYNRLGQFTSSEEQAKTGYFDEILYSKIVEYPGYLDWPMEIFRERALPYIAAFHEPRKYRNPYKPNGPAHSGPSF